MKIRNQLIWLLSVLALATMVGVCIEGKELSQLRSSRAELLRGDSIASEPAEGSQPSEVATSPSKDQQSELLQLRNEISQLNRRKKELANVSPENSRLRAELQAKTAASKKQAVPGYIKQSEAVMVGFARPEDTLQTFLWAVRNRDTNTLLQSLGPQLRPELEHGQLEDLKAFVGAGVTARTNLPDGAVRLTVRIVSDMPLIGIVFRDVGGAWKIEKME